MYIKYKKHQNYIRCFFMLKDINDKIDKLNKNLEKTNLMELSYIMGNKKEILKRNLLAGISRGVGITIGVTIITAIIIYILQKLLILNIPLIGDYIVDIIEVVDRRRY